MCDELKFDLTQNEVQKVTQFNDSVLMSFANLQQEVLQNGCWTVSRDFRCDFEWKKSEAHRKQVLTKSQKKALQTGKYRDIHYNIG